MWSNANLLQKTRWQNQQNSVKYKTNSPAKLFPHILIKMLHNGWPKKHKEKGEIQKRPLAGARQTDQQHIDCQKLVGMSKAPLISLFLP